MKNRSLKRDLKQILKEHENVAEIKKGDISDFSIEFEFKEPQSFSSYLFYEDEIGRDADFAELQEILKMQ